MVKTFIAELNQKFGGGYEACKSGAKYTRIIKRGSAVCFIDTAGNIYKPASWKGPAKGIRATLATVDMNKVDQFGVWLYR